jgi:uncharacterized membrane protein (UPF0127 family)
MRKRRRDRCELWEIVMGDWRVRHAERLNSQAACPLLVKALAAAILVCFAAGFLVLHPAKAQDELEPLSVVTGTGTYQFLVEVMRTEAQRERGLMFRRHLPQDRGMLFDFGAERPVAMWMKNTYLPLDMIFIAKSGKVVALAQNAEPMSERIIPSGVPVSSVLEVNGGTAAKIGLKVGDLVRHPLFQK